MNCTVKIKGTVNNSFILRGMLHEIGSVFDTYVKENEVDFVMSKLDNAEKIINTEIKPIIEPTTAKTTINEQPIKTTINRPRKI